MITTKPKAATHLAASLQWYSEVQQLSKEQLSGVLDISMQVFEGILRGDYIADSLTAEALVRIFWILGLNEADPAAFGWDKSMQTRWVQEKSEYVSEKRREVYRLALTNQHAHARSEYRWVRALCMLFAVITVGTIMGSLIIGTSASVFLGVAAAAFVSSLLTLGSLMGLSIRKDVIRRLEDKL